MFWFKKKKKYSLTDDIKKMAGFRKVGEKFNYLGVELIVESHTLFTGDRFAAGISASYKNNNGDLKSFYFYLKDLPCLIAENPE